MVWAAIFLLCSSSDCLTAGSPLFRSKQDCEYSTMVYGLGLINNRFPDYVLMRWMCVSFGEVEIDGNVAVDPAI